MQSVFEKFSEKSYDGKKQYINNTKTMIDEIKPPFAFSAGHLLKFTVRRSFKQNGEKRRLYIDVDLSINRNLEILNTTLILTYCLFDERYRKIAMVLKIWNRNLKVKNKWDRLNSFSMYLLLLAFMLQEKYLPNI